VVPQRVEILAGVDRGVGSAGELGGVLFDTAATDVLEIHNPGQFFAIDTGFIIDVAAGIGQCHDFTAEVENLLGGVLSDITGTGHEAGLAFEGFAAGAEHFGREVDCAITGGFRTNQGAAPVEAFTGQHAGEFVAELLVGAEEETDFTAADADVTGGNVGVRADVAEQFGHESLAEAHHFIITFTLGIEIGTTLTAAHRERGQAVFEYLLEGQKLQDTLVDRRVQAQTAFVRSDGAVHFDTETTVDVVFTLVIDPRHAEGDQTFRLGNAFHDFVLAVFGVFFQDERNGLDDFLDCLMEFGFGRVLGLDPTHKFRNII